MPKSAYLRSPKLSAHRKGIFRKRVLGASRNPAAPAAEFIRIGKNWHNSVLPVAVLVGFPDYLAKIITPYFKDSKILFVPPELELTRICAELDQFDDAALYIWGEAGLNPEVLHYAADRRLPISLVRLGPLCCLPNDTKIIAPDSLIFESLQGGSNPQNLLAKKNIIADSVLLQKACYLLELYKSLGVGQTINTSYAPIDKVLGLTLDRRILVCGENMAESLQDPYLHLSRLVDQATRENPGAEILYLPASSWLPGNVDNFGVPEGVKRLPADIDLASLFAKVDRVYAHTGYAGFEALLHGLPVSLRGVPFYANCGLTHDIKIDTGRRKRHTMEELFCAEFLLAPRYLVDTGDNVISCLAAILRLYVERQENILGKFTSKFITANFQTIAKSEWWPVLFRPGQFAEKFKKGGNFAQLCNLRGWLGDDGSVFWQEALILCLAGQTINTPAYGGFLAALLQLIDADLNMQILDEIWRAYPQEIILLRKAQIYQKKKEEDLAYATYQTAASFTSGQKLEPPVPMQKWSYALRKAHFEKEQAEYETSVKSYFALLLSGLCSAELFCGLGEIAISRFDFDSACRFFTFAAILEPNYRNGWPWLQAAIALTLADRDQERVISYLALACWRNPKHLGADLFAFRHGNIFLENLPVRDALLQIRPPQSRNRLDQTEGFIRCMQPEMAEATLKCYIAAESEKSRFYRCLALSFMDQERYDEGITLLAAARKLYPEKDLYQDLLRLCIVKGDFEQALQFLQEAERLTVEINEIYRTRIYFGREQPQKAYQSFRISRTLPRLKNYLGDKYVQSIQELKGAQSILIAATFGPADEVRFASFYPRMLQELAPAKISFTCDPRLHNLLQRSFPEIEFIPAARCRTLLGVKNLDVYRELPASMLHMVFDNSSWALAQKMDKVTIAMDLLGDLIVDKSSFSGQSFLRADDARVNYWRERLKQLANGRRIIGLSWRSHLLTSSRNMNYFTIRQLAPIFNNPGIVFVNLQYDDCAEELEWVNANFPGSLINFAEIDQFNDLDETAALMKSLDLVIAPATTVIELAGALGCPSALLANSAELRWRTKNGNMDIWHNSLYHITGDRPGHKESLLNNLAQLLKKLANV